MAKRGRPPRTERRYGADKSPLNAMVNEQLLLDFNGFSQNPENWTGTRDELVEFVLRTFLDSPRKPPQRASRVPEEQKLHEATAATAYEARSVFNVIAGARRHAEAIVVLTAPYRAK